MSKLFLFRHGVALEPEQSSKLLGSLDYPLTAQGQKEAAYWQKKLIKIPFDLAWSSPLLRAKQTAQIILANRTLANHIQEIPSFTEISLGLWEGLTKAEIKQNYPQAWDLRGQDIVNIAPPKGESFQALAKRVLTAFELICIEARQKENSILVAHQAVNRVILAHLLKKNLANILELACAPASLSVLNFQKNGAIIISKQVVPNF